MKLIPLRSPFRAGIHCIGDQVSSNLDVKWERPDRPQAFMTGDKMSEKLSPRQKEICDLVAQGRTNAEIAGPLGTAVSAAKSAVHTIFDEVGASDRAELARMTSGECHEEFSPEGERCALLFLQGLLHARIQSGRE